MFTETCQRINFVSYQSSMNPLHEIQSFFFPEKVPSNIYLIYDLKILFGKKQFLSGSCQYNCKITGTLIDVQYFSTYSCMFLFVH